MKENITSDVIKPRRADGQKTGLSGEFFVAAELLKRGLQTSVTFGNAKAIDLFAVNEITGKVFTIQVKALRRPNFFPIATDKIQRKCVYVFVVLNDPGVAPDYYIVPGEHLFSEPARFGKWFLDYDKFPGIQPKDLTDYRDRWEIFEC